MITYNNLKIETTRRCTLRCKHCEKGPASGKDFQAKLLPKIFTKDTIIHNLELDGGDVLLAADILEMIVDYIIQSESIVLGVSITTNGTYFTPKSKRILSKLKTYITKCQSHIGKYSKAISLILAADEYHKAELNRIKEEDPWIYKMYMENIQELIESSYFSCKKESIRVIDKGRAENLAIEKFYPPKIDNYYLKDEKNVLISNASVLVDGIVENTGESLLDDNLASIIIKSGIACKNEVEFQNGCQINEYNSKNLTFVNKEINN